MGLAQPTATHNAESTRDAPCHTAQFPETAISVLPQCYTISVVASCSLVASSHFPAVQSPSPSPLQLRRRFTVSRPEGKSCVILSFPETDRLGFLSFPGSGDEEAFADAQQPIQALTGAADANPQRVPALLRPLHQTQ